MSSPSSPTTTLDAAPAQSPAPGNVRSFPGSPPPRPPSGGGGRSSLMHQLMLALVCAAYAVGAAFDWGTNEISLIMGDFGLSAAGGTAAVSCFLYARDPRAGFRPDRFGHSRGHFFRMHGEKQAAAELGDELQMTRGIIFRFLDGKRFRSFFDRFRGQHFETW